MDSDNIFQISLKDSENFDTKFLDLLCEKSQLLCKPSSSPSPDEEYLSCKNFLKDFENYIIGTSDINLISTSSTNSICGKIFKTHEPVYACRDCSTDDTCVFCRICFLKSEHVKHNYEMYVSSGGGYCDCGDEEAWKSYPRCSLHTGSVEITATSLDTIETTNDVTLGLETVPDDVKLRFLKISQLLFENFQRFVMRPLCKSDGKMRSDELEKELSFARTQLAPTRPQEFSLVLYNNEFHNFDQVINLFKRCLQCSTEQAMALANIVDRDGRCMALLSTDRDEVESKQKDILNRSKSQTTMELLCRLHSPLVWSLQTFLVHGLRWLYEFVDRYPRLRLVLCQYLFVDYPASLGVVPRCSFIQDIFEKHVELWKSARSVCTNFLMTAVFKETYFKKLFVIEMARNYQMVMDHFSADDHNTEDSLKNLNCQIFTVISFAKYLLEHHNVLDSIMGILYNTLAQYSKPLRHPNIDQQVIMHFEKEENEINRKFDPFERRMRSLDDLKFLLTSLLTAFVGHREDNDMPVNFDNGDESTSLWTEKAVTNFLKYFRTFSAFLSLIQDADTIERVTDHHVEHDPNWKTGIVMMYDALSCLSLTSKLIVSNRECWDRGFEIIRQVIKSRIVDLEHPYSKQFHLFSYSTLVIDNESPSRTMSVIKPLHRFMAALLVDKKYREMLNNTEKDCLLDQALQMLVFASQQAGNMWIRNGSVPYILTQQMKCLILSSEMFDRDLQLIQQMAICMNPEKFILKCVHKFDLKNLLKGETCSQLDRKALLQRIEDFLHTLIMTIFFRYRIGIGKQITKDDIYAHIILHILAIKSISHSKLMKKLSPNVQKCGNLMEIIDKVADQSMHSQVVIFSAKKSLLLSQFDRYSPYYSIQDRNEAELCVQNFFKKEGLPNVVKPPVPIDLTDDSARLADYVSSPCFVEILNKFLYFARTKRNGEFWTDTILDMVLYLIGASLLEDTKNLEKSPELRRPLFISTATNQAWNVDIVGNLEVLCDQIVCDQQLELIKWTIRKWNEVVRLTSCSGSELPVRDNQMEIDTSEKEIVIDQTVNQNKASKADAVIKRREQLMNKMWKMQKKFINENSELLTTGLDPSNPQDAVSSPTDEPRPEETLDFTCILCQEKMNYDVRDRPIVLIAGAWRSPVLAKHPFIIQTPKQLQPTRPIQPANLSDETDFELLSEATANSLPAWNQSHEEDSTNDIDRVVMRSIIPMLDHPEETFITTCGHVMHYDCKTNYIKEMVRQKQNVARTKGVLYPRIYNRCPLCKCVCNIDIPIIKAEINEEWQIVTNGAGVVESSGFSDWLEAYQRWTPGFFGNNSVEPKKVDGSISWWNKLSTHLSNFMRSNSSLKGNSPRASDEDLISCLAYRTALAIKLQPSKLTKDTYKRFENVCSSISESSSQELIELDYAVMHTMSVWEKIMSKQHCSLLSDMPERHANGLRTLIKAVCRSHRYFVYTETVSRECHSFFMFLHQMLFECTSVSFHKAWVELNRFHVPLFVLEVDFTFMLGTLLFLRYSLSRVATESEETRMFLDKSRYNFSMVRLLYQFSATQALLSLSTYFIDGTVEDLYRQLSSHSPSIWSTEHVNALHSLCRFLGDRVVLTKTGELSPETVAVCFSRSLLPFLRCAVYLLHEMGSVQIPIGFAHWTEEFNQLITVLRLDLVPYSAQQTPNYIDQHLQLIAHRKVMDPRTFWSTQLPHIMPEKPPKLIDLPREFTDVITIALEKGCSLSEQVTGTVSEISICLICGVTVCVNGYCCRRIEESSGIVISGAQRHTRQCHEGYSLFLNTRNSKIIVFFYQARWQIYLDPVYLDKFGESNVDLRRGNPLFLNEAAYAKLERSWLDHSVGCIINDSFFSNDFFV